MPYAIFDDGDDFELKTVIMIMSKRSQFEKFLIVAVNKWRRVVIEDGSEVRKGHHSLTAEMISRIKSFL